MIIKTTRSRLATAVDVVVTAVAWIAFVYLFGSGVMEILEGHRQSGPGMRIPYLLPTLGTLGDYALVALLNAGILISWAWYNFLRFRGMDRRKHPAPLTDAQVAQGFHLPLEQRLNAAGAKSMTIRHGKEGNIADIEVDIPLRS